MLHCSPHLPRCSAGRTLPVRRHRLRSSVHAGSGRSTHPGRPCLALRARLKTAAPNEQGGHEVRLDWGEKQAALLQPARSRFADYWATRRRSMKPMAPRPASISAYVSGSGTGLTEPE